ncbi:pirin family protein [Legionella spiritensis]|uniref:pirin family protein n=1 Tax=Legionella spiritensis TaxID=452 RepID=UPI000F6CAC7F|nr:pirin family protein [Legionella spiritensis]VEG91603.1 pirin-like protein [Legionella spiritensis]
MVTITISQLLTGTLMREGAGVKLHRYIGADRQNPYEPFLLFDFFDSSDPMDYLAGFPQHPHRGFETVTYLLDGRITHQDNHGHQGTIDAGGVQWMTAGSGIIHSEMPQQGLNGRMRGLQLWLNLPADRKWTPPAYQEFTADQLPVETLASGVRIKAIAGKTPAGMPSPVKGIATAPLFLDISLPAGQTFTQPVSPGHQAILFVLDGTVFIERQSVEAQVLAVLTDGDQITISADENPVHCLLVTAKKLREPIARLGPFVMNTHEEVMDALDDFRNNRF